MKRIAVIGAGFAGLFAVRRLSRKARGASVRVVVYDGKTTCDLLLALPDVVGGRIGAANTAHPIAPFAARHGASFVNSPVRKIDLNKATIQSSAGEETFDYILIATGMQTTFYGQNRFRDHTLTLDSMREARDLHLRLRSGGFDSILVIGGGYTGIEIATQARALLLAEARSKPVHLVEIGPRILPGLPETLAAYSRRNLERMGISVHTMDALEDVDGTTAVLRSGKTFENTLVVWSAGKAAPELLQGLDTAKSKAGRLATDPFLRVSEHCFAAGDAASVLRDGKELRMSIQFAISGGVCAATNILRVIEGRSMKTFRPADLGYVIPMANWRSCGKVLGIPVKGRLPSFLHYFMSVFRSFGTANRMGIIQDLMHKRPVSDLPRE